MTARPDAQPLSLNRHAPAVSPSTENPSPEMGLRISPERFSR